MSMFDYNDAEPQRAGFGLIPDGEIALVIATLRPGGHGPGNWLKNNKNGDCLMADFQFTIEDGKYDRQKFWSLFVTEGETEGQQKAAHITRSKLRAMLESAYNIHPGDDGPEAMKKRQVAGWQAFDGLKFCAKIGVEAGKDGYKDKNVLAEAITPDAPDYINPGPQQGGMKTAGAAVQSAGKAAGGNTAAATSGSKPKWAS